ncbi:ATP-binding cassette domain-containing protein [Bradyrhizobium sp. Arg237L]|uniref:ABC transporter ATP-binding protein n=1 Tax=Bradyrhizobium sp. Arg237L TaxID=3003352 RepID=UPI00249F3739|nr:ATP-binding cassette domain-containing protein [Bradyrhizobium sp. Arg237L]MDI4233489.1 ATP-binding cassette domain-containing protein [Bradyrhizobium sp. Arg237L]
MISAAATAHDTSRELLRVEDLVKRYGREAAVAHVSCSVATGEILGIVGPNGAGKTTLLEALVGLLAAEQGAVFWCGEELPPPRRKEALFYLPDGMRPYQDRFAIDVMTFFARVYRRTDAQTAATITAVGLTPVLGKRVHALSKGYNRRLLLGIGLLTPHDVLVMDEPFDGFDIRQTRTIIDVIRQEATRGRTFILAIHQLADAERVCDRFLLLAGGKTRGIGTLDELRAKTALASGSLEEIFLALT